MTRTGIATQMKWWIKSGSRRLRNYLRADILIYGKDGSPLAIVECKEPEVEISAKTAQQALLYYAVLKADFIFLTNGKKTYIYKRKGESFDAMDHFPDLAEMEKR